MSGLELQETKQEYLDDIEDRYHQVACIHVNRTLVQGFLQENFPSKPSVKQILIQAACKIAP